MAGGSPPFSRVAPALCISASLLCVALLASRIAFLGPPMVFADEYAYAAWSYWVFNRDAFPEGHAAIVHTWFYAGLASVVHFDGGRLIEKIRVFNVLVAALALFPLYRLASHTLNRAFALGLSVLFTWAALGGYIAFFMPDGMFSVLYVALFVIMVEYLRAPGWRPLLAAAVVHGLLIATKPHGLLALPAFGGLLALYDTAQGRVRFNACGMRAAIIYGVIAFVVFSTIDSAMWGKLVVNPFSDHYNGTSTGWGDKILDPEFLRRCMYVAWRHLAFVGAVAGLPLSLVVVSAMRALRRVEDGADPRASWLRAGSLFALFGYLSFFAVTVLFTVAIVGQGPYESLARVHGRYYDFAMTVIFFHAIVLSAVEWRTWSFRLRAALVLLTLVGAGVAYVALKSATDLGVVDFALGASLYDSPRVRALAIALAITSAAVFLLRPRHTAAALALALGVYLVCNVHVVDQYRIGAGSGPIDRFGMMMDMDPKRPHQYAAFRARDVDAYRAAFYMVGDGKILPVAADGTVDCSKVAQPAAIISLHDIPVACGLVPEERQGGALLSVTPEPPAQ